MTFTYGLCETSKHTASKNVLLIWQNTVRNMYTNFSWVTLFLRNIFSKNTCLKTDRLYSYHLVVLTVLAGVLLFVFFQKNFLWHCGSSEVCCFRLSKVVHLLYTKQESEEYCNHRFFLLPAATRIRNCKIIVSFINRS